jgi:hypothetical protein
MKIGEYTSKEMPLEGCTKPMIGFFNKEGDYIGGKEWAERLTKRGISAIKAEENHNICSIGFCEKDQKWYGWSHRAIYGYGIGHIVKEGSCESTSGWTDDYLKDHPDDKPMPIGFECETLEDCKRCAIAFAASVS